ncbi:MAG: hypothetical protein F6K10_13715 [Moorea sp. SIO2B7]|nr:hypothetical protein [Moorena sp. SIO2B7]
MSFPVPEFVEALISELLSRFRLLVLIFKLPELPIPVACTVNLPLCSWILFTGF